MAYEGGYFEIVLEHCFRFQCIMCHPVFIYAASSITISLIHLNAAVITQTQPTVSKHPESQEVCIRGIHECSSYPAMQCIAVTTASQAASSPTYHFSVTVWMASLQDGREQRELNKQMTKTWHRYKYWFLERVSWSDRAAGESTNIE